MCAGPRMPPRAGRRGVGVPGGHLPELFRTAGLARRCSASRGLRIGAASASSWACGIRHSVHCVLGVSAPSGLRSGWHARRIARNAGLGGRVSWSRPFFQALISPIKVMRRPAESAATITSDARRPDRMSQECCWARWCRFAGRVVLHALRGGEPLAPAWSDEARTMGINVPARCDCSHRWRRR